MNREVITVAPLRWYDAAFLVALVIGACVSLVAVGWLAHGAHTRSTRVGSPCVVQPTTSAAPGVILGTSVRPGDSGAPVYCEDGSLVGIATRRGEGAFAFEPVDAYWLEGT